MVIRVGAQNLTQVATMRRVCDEPSFEYYSEDMITITLVTLPNTQIRPSTMRRSMRQELRINGKGNGVQNE